MASRLTSGVLCQYADDTSIIITGANTTSLEERCAIAVGDMANWCHSQKLKLNAEKTRLLHFQNRATADDLRVSYEGRDIPTNDVVNFLGMTVDAQLRWGEHCDALTGKLSSAVFGMRTLRGVISLDALKMFYYAYVESRLRYGVIFWGSSSHSIRVFRVQKRVVRCMFGEPQTASCRPLFKTLKIMPLGSIYIFELLTHYVKNKGAYRRNNDISTSCKTRNGDDLSIPKHKTHLYESSPHYKAIICYNKLPKTIKNCKAPKQFRAALKEYLVRESFYSLDEFFNV